MSFSNLMRFHWKDYRRETLILFSVLLAIDIVQVIIWIFFPDLDTVKFSILFNINRIIIVTFTIINVIVTASVTFPLMTSFSVTRRDFYTTTLLALLLFCISAAFVEALLFELSRSLIPRIDNVMEIGSSVPFLTHWYVFTISLTVVAVTTLLITSCFYRFGSLSGIFSVIIFVCILNLFANLLPSLDFADEPGVVPLVSDTPLLIGVIVLAGAIGWLIYRKAPIKI